nr:CPBP family intramembrane glutamic endopeptidase [Lewinella sp. JB7]
MYYGNGLLLLGLSVIVLIVWALNGRPLTELGLGWGRTPYDTAALLVIFGFLVLYAVDLFAEIGSPTRKHDTLRKFRELGFLPTDGSQYLHFLFLCACAGVGEEIVYRGFMVTYLQETLQQNIWGIAGTLIVPALSFGLAHIYQGTHAVAKIIAMALLFGFFFYRTGSLWPLILLHTAIDAVGGLLSWYLEGND